MIRRTLNPRQAIRALRFAGFRWFILVQPYHAFLPAFAGNELGLDVSGLGMLAPLMGVVTALSSLSRLSTLPAGALADRYGVPLVVGVMAVLLIVVYVVVGLSIPRLKE